MRLWAKILLGIVIIVVLLVGYLFYGFYRFSVGGCENESCRRFQTLTKH